MVVKVVISNTMLPPTVNIERVIIKLSNIYLYPQQLISHDHIGYITTKKMDLSPNSDSPMVLIQPCSYTMCVFASRVKVASAFCGVSNDDGFKNTARLCFVSANAY